MSIIEIARDQTTNPLDVVEHMAAGNNWPFERAGEDEIAIVVTGRWTNYQISFTWMSEIEALHLACAFDMRVPEPRLSEVQQLVALINEQLWIGHFDVWMQNGVVMFRHALLLPAASPLRAGNARRCSGPRSTPANAIIRRSSSWSGRANPRAKPWTPPCSRHPARRNTTPMSASDPATAGAPDLRDFSGLLVLVGAGKMGSALLDGWLRFGLKPTNVAVIEPSAVAANQDAGRARRAAQSRCRRADRRCRHRHCGEAANRRAGDAGAGADDRRVDDRDVDHGRADAAIPVRAH